MISEDVRSCDTCGSTVKVERQPSASQLIFGGFNVRFCDRCAKCERELSKSLMKMLENLSK